MDVKKVASTLNGAYNAPIDFGANVNATPTNQGQMANLQAAQTLMAQGDRAGYASSAIGGAASEQAEQERQAARDALAKKEAEIKAKEEEEKRRNDPDNFKAIVNDAGGYDFYDPDGNPISAVDYARKKNMQLTDVYKDSQDPNDKTFVEDYNTLFKLGQAMQSNDAKALKKIFKEDPMLEEQMKANNYTFADVRDAFRKKYSGYMRPKELTYSDMDKNKVIDTGQDTRSLFDKVKSGLTFWDDNDNKPQYRW